MRLNVLLWVVSINSKARTMPGFLWYKHDCKQCCLVLFLDFYFLIDSLMLLVCLMLSIIILLLYGSIHTTMVYLRQLRQNYFQILSKDFFTPFVLVFLTRLVVLAFSTFILTYKICIYIYQYICKKYVYICISSILRTFANWHTNSKAHTYQRRNRVWKWRGKLHCQRGW